MKKLSPDTRNENLSLSKAPEQYTQPFEQRTIEQLYSNRLQEKHCLHGVTLKTTTNTLLDQYLQNKSKK